MKRKATPTASLTATACPCGGGDYATCCGPFHAGERLPETAEALMRSRYSAYVMQRTDYLLDTWDPASCPAELDDAASPQWLGLKIVAHTPIDASRAEVEFVARYKINGRAYRLHERSRFTRMDGKWRYVDGDILE